MTPPVHTSRGDAIRAGVEVVRLYMPDSPEIVHEKFVIDVLRWIEKTGAFLYADEHEQLHNHAAGREILDRDYRRCREEVEQLTEERDQLREQRDRGWGKYYTEMAQELEDDRVRQDADVRSLRAENQRLEELYESAHESCGAFEAENERLSLKLQETGLALANCERQYHEFRVQTLGATLNLAFVEMQAKILDLERALQECRGAAFDA